MPLGSEAGSLTCGLASVKSTHSVTQDFHRNKEPRGRADPQCHTVSNLTISPKLSFSEHRLVWCQRGRILLSLSGQFVKVRFLLISLEFLSDCLVLGQNTGQTDGTSGWEGLPHSSWLQGDPWWEQLGLSHTRSGGSEQRRFLS